MGPLQQAPSYQAKWGSENPLKSPPRRSTRGEVYSRQALEKALSTNPTPLLLFAAFKDFTGENIGFLDHVRQWKATWNPSSKTPRSTFTTPKCTALEGEALRRHQFSLAVEIYLSFVSMQHSDFPVNLSSAHLKALNEIFGTAAATINTTTVVQYGVARSVKTRGSRPFDVEHGSDKELVSVTSSYTLNDTNSVDSSHVFGVETTSVDKFKSLNVKPLLPPWVAIPDTFGSGVFDHAEESIKYMVLTNTWPRFIDAGYANSIEPMRAGILAWLADVLRAR